MSNKQKVLAHVSDILQLSPNMKRVVLQSPAFASYSKPTPGDYFKLLFDEQGQPVTDLEGDDNKLILRTYTIRALNREQATLTFDCALHPSKQTDGPALRWLQSVALGDKVCVYGQGSLKPLPEKFDEVMFAGDMTALPAIESYLEQLPANMRGCAVIKVLDAADARELAHPVGVKIHWLYTQNCSLAEQLSRLQKPSTSTALWAASEFHDMREMRSLFVNEWALSRDDFYLSSYWKKGRTDEQHRVDKRADANATAQN